MSFWHDPGIWQRFPTLAAVAADVADVDRMGAVCEPVARHLQVASDRLALADGDDGAEGRWPEIQAWRRVFSQLGLKPTQVRCAAEALLRRLRKEGSLPTLHPLIDLCNALSVRFAVPVAVFDADRVAWPLVVREADGSEHHESFSGASESPERGEIIFADAQGHAHARRWAHRQSRKSGVTAATRRVLVVAEAHHAGGADGIDALQALLAEDLVSTGARVLAARRLTSQSPRFDLQRTSSGAV